jgi:hypothetical protein
MMSVNFDPQAVLPEELFFHILSFLEIPGVGNCCQVNHQWNRVANDNLLWSQIARRVYRITSNAGGMKGFVRAMPSNEELIRLMKEFVVKVSLGQVGTFRCIFGSEDEISIAIQPNGQPQLIAGRTNIIEEHLLIRNLDDEPLNTPIPEAEPCPNIFRDNIGRCVRCRHSGLSTTYESQKSSDDFRISMSIPPEGRNTSFEARIKYIVCNKLLDLAKQADQQAIKPYINAAVTTGVFLIQSSLAYLYYKYL